MATLLKKEKKALMEFKKQLTNKLGSKLAHFFLFGSKAKGNAKTNSDVDVLVVLNSQNWDEKKEVTNIAYEIMLEFNINLAPIVIFSKDWRKYRSLPTSFSFLLKREAISL